MLILKIEVKDNGLGDIYPKTHPGWKNLIAAIRATQKEKGNSNEKNPQSV